MAVELLNEVFADVDAYWSAALAPFGLDTPPHTAWIAPQDDGAISACGVRSARFTAGYCAIDDTISVGELFALGAWSGFSDVGVAVTVAHEYGHHLQAVLGLIDVGDGPSLELQADCLAGWWLRAVDDTGRLQAGGEEAGERFFAAIGDDAVGEPDHHGTSAERQGAFRRGFDHQRCPVDGAGA